MHEELQTIGNIEEWFHCQHIGSLSGSLQLESFEQAFSVLTKGISIKNVHFQHRWYTNWSWICSKNTNPFFDQLAEKMNDDCIREIIKYMDVLHLIHFAEINNRFKVLTEERFSHLRIFSSTVGSIGLINFRYLLEMYGGSVKELSISLNAFPTIYGFHFDFFKRYILRTIHKCSGPKLKKIYCYDFAWPVYENENFDQVLQMFKLRNIEIIFN